MKQVQRQDDAVRDWIRSQAPEAAPDRLRDALRTELDRTSQRDGPWSATVDGLARLRLAAVGAVVIMVVALAAIGPLRWGTPFDGRGPGSSASPSSVPPSVSPSPSPSPSPTPPGSILPAGSFSTSGFTPAVSLIVPPGWTLELDSRDLLILVRPDAGSFRQHDGLVLFDDVAIYARPKAGQPDGAQEPVVGVGSGPQELATWLSERPQLIATTPIETTIAGRTAYSLDFTVAPTAGELCGVPCTNLLDGPSASSYAFGVSGPSKTRVFLLAAPNGETVMVAIEDVDGLGFDAEARVAQTLIDAIAFVP